MRISRHSERIDASTNRRMGLCRDRYPSEPAQDTTETKACIPSNDTTDKRAFSFCPLLVPEHGEIEKTYHSLPRHRPVSSQPREFVCGREDVTACGSESGQSCLCVCTKRTCIFFEGFTILMTKKKRRGCVVEGDEREREKSKSGVLAAVWQDTTELDDLLRRTFSSSWIPITRLMMKLRARPNTPHRRIKTSTDFPLCLSLSLFLSTRVAAGCRETSQLDQTRVVPGTLCACRVFCFFSFPLTAAGQRNAQKSKPTKISLVEDFLQSSEKILKRRVRVHRENDTKINNFFSFFLVFRRLSASFPALRREPHLFLRASTSSRERARRKRRRG